MQELVCAECIKDNVKAALTDLSQAVDPKVAVTFVNGTALCELHSREVSSS